MVQSKNCNLFRLFEIGLNIELTEMVPTPLTKRFHLDKYVQLQNILRFLNFIKLGRVKHITKHDLYPLCHYYLFNVLYRKVIIVYPLAMTINLINLKIFSQTLNSLNNSVHFSSSSTFYTLLYIYIYIRGLTK